MGYLRSRHATASVPPRRRTRLGAGSHGTAETLEVRRGEGLETGESEQFWPPRGQRAPLGVVFACVPRCGGRKPSPTVAAGSRGWAVRGGRASGLFPLSAGAEAGLSVEAPHPHPVNPTQLLRLRSVRPSSHLTRRVVLSS